MIQRIRFLNFRALRDVSVELERLTVLVGPNGAGKTAVLEGLQLMSQLAGTDPRFVFAGPSDVGLISSRGASGHFELALEGQWRGKPGALSITFPTIEEYPFADTYVLETRWGEQRLARRQELHLPGEEHTEQPLALVLRGAEPLALDPRQMALPSCSDEPTPRVGADGAGLAAMLADMAVARPDDFLRLQDALRAVVPQLLRVRLVRAKVWNRKPEPAPDDGAGEEHASAPDRGPPSTRVAGSRDFIGAPDPYDRPQGDRSGGGEGPRAQGFQWGYEIVFDMTGAPDIPARAASRGTLLALGLFATLMAPERPLLLLIDDLEVGLAPGAMGELVSQIRRVLTASPRMQIVATSHSPILLDHLSAEEVRVMTVRPDGAVGCAPLTASPDYALLREDMRPGELWTTVGDEWVSRYHPRPRRDPSDEDFEDAP